MSTKTLRDDKKLAKNVMISQRYLGIVLRRNSREQRRKSASSMMELAGANGSAGGTLAVNNHADSSVGGDSAEDWMFESGYLIFQEFQEENRRCYWNRTLIDSVDNVEYMGYVAPGTLLICGNEYYLEALRSAWGRRVLKSPANFVIKRLGDVTGLEMQVIPQTQFTPLPEALCLVISDLNGDNETASLQIIFCHLQERFCDMIVPNQEIVYSSLGKLIKDRKVYHTGDGYFIVTPETYHMTTISSIPERPLLMTNDEAIHKLHGGELLAPLKPSQTRTRSIQTNMDDLTFSSDGKSPSFERRLSPSKLERSGSLRLSRKEKYKSQDDGSFVRSESMRLSPGKSKSLIKDINLKSSPLHQDVEKGEKISVFSKLFRRSSSKRRKESKSPTKFATFSAQFPPIEWSDPSLLYYHSRSTQTLEGRQSSQRSLSSSASPRTTPPGAVLINNNVTSSAANGHHHNNSSSSANNSSSSHNSVKSKTDSLIRLRDHDTSPRGGSSTHRLRSSTIESMTQSSSADNNQSAPSSGDARASAAPPKSSGLPRKILSHSCVAQQQDVAALQSQTSSSQQQRRHHSSSPKKNATSASARTSLSHLGTPSKSSSSRHDSPRRDTTLKSSSATSNHNTEDTSNLHASAAALFKVEDKVKNTEVRHHHQRGADEEYRLSEVHGYGELAARRSAKCVTNRWSVHGAESLNQSGGPTSSSTPMNNASSPVRKPSSSWNTSSSGNAKCVNKLHQGSAPSTGSVNSAPSVPTSSSSSANNRPVSNVTASVKPTQAIRPLNQMASPYHHHSDKSGSVQNNGTTDIKVSNFNNDSSGQQLTPSPSFSKSFDLESTAFKSITAHKLLKGISIASIDTLVEVNMAAEDGNCCHHNNGHSNHQMALQSQKACTSPNGTNTALSGGGGCGSPSSVTSPILSPISGYAKNGGKLSSASVAPCCSSSAGNDVALSEMKDNNGSQHMRMVAKQKMSYLTSNRSDAKEHNEGKDFSKSKIANAPETTKVTALV